MHKHYQGTTVNDFYNVLSKDFNLFVDEILRYESDTFSAEGSNLTPNEAEQIAYNFMLEDLRSRTETRTMDGTMIAEKLEYIRESVLA